MKYCVIPVTSLNQNCSLVWCEKTRDAVVIDPGGEVDLLCQEISFRGVGVKKILLTHGHIDHVGGAQELSQFYSVPIFGPNYADKILLNNIDFQCYIFGFDKISPVIPDIWLSDYDTVQVGTITFTVLHCPGHSPGHVVFWDQESKFIIMGDVLFRGNIGRTDLPGGDEIALKQSIKKLFVLCEHASFLPGHGPESVLDYEFMTNPSLQDL